MADSISISIPAFNEASTLEGLVNNSVSVLAQYTEDYEVLIINDGSSDTTGQIADRLASANPKVRVIHHPHNLGFGLTLQEIFTKPTKEWVFFIPGDGQIPPDVLKTLHPWRNTADFILGHRVNRQDPLSRRITATIYNLLISALVGRRIYDVDSVVLFRRSILNDISLMSRSVFLHAEFCLKAIENGARVIEVPIDHRPRLSGAAAGNKPRVIFETLRELVQFAWTHHSFRK